MKETVHCTKSPPLTEWVQVLVDRGWKLVDHGADEVRGKKEIGQSRYPVMNATVWNLTLSETVGRQMKVEVEVPAFADGPFSRARIYEEVKEIADEAGEVRVEEDLRPNLLEEVR